MRGDFRDGYTLHDAACTITGHLLCMFVPGLLTGSVIDAIGKLNVVLLGLLVLAGSCWKHSCCGSKLGHLTLLCRCRQVVWPQG